MDDFERGAREMQRVAAEAMDALVLQAENAQRTTSTGLDRGLAITRIKQMAACYRQAAAVIRSISIEGTINAVMGDER